MSTARIIGIDPGLQAFGWAIIDHNPDGISLVGLGSCKTSSSVSLQDRLGVLHKELSAVISQYQPLYGAIEKVFINKNAGSSMLLSHARGAIILSAYLAGLPLMEYDATSVKRIVTGSGHSSKEQLVKLLSAQLPFEIPLSDHHATDALAMAFCYTLQPK